MTKVEGVHECKLVGVGHLSAILAIIGWTKLIFELDPGFDGSNPYIKIERNQNKND